jgi:hypothetical protein
MSLEEIAESERIQGCQMRKKALKLLNDSQDNHNSYTVSEFVPFIKLANHRKNKTKFYVTTVHQGT